MSENGTPNGLLRTSRALGIPDHFAAGNYARLAESVKNFAALGSQSNKVPKWLRRSFTAVAIAASGVMIAFYNELGRKWLRLDSTKKVQALEAEEPETDLSPLGELMTGYGMWKPSDAMNNATNLLNIVGTIAGMASRAKGIAGTPCSDILSYGSVGTGLAMAGFEAGFARLLYKGKKAVQDAAAGVINGGGWPSFKMPSFDLSGSNFALAPAGT